MPSTPDPLIEVIAAELRRTVEGGETVTDAAERLLDAITATGRLLHRGVVVIATTEAAGGFEERTEHGFRYRASGKDWTRIVPARSAKEAASAACWLAAGATEAQALRRSVYLGPWEPQATPDTTGTEEGA